MDGIYAYKAICVLADALERAKSTEKEKLVVALSKTNYKDHILANPNPITYGQSNTSCNVTHQIVKGIFEIVLPKMWQTVKPIYPIPKWGNRV